MNRAAWVATLVGSPMFVTFNASAVPTSNALAEVRANLARDCPECPALLPVPSGKRLGFRHVTASKITWNEYGSAVAAAGCSTPLARPERLAPTKDMKLRISRADALFKATTTVTGISLEDARCYAEWLTRRSGHKYSVPTPAQWGTLRPLAEAGRLSGSGDKLDGIVIGELTSDCVKWGKSHPASDPHWVCQVFGRAFGMPQPDLERPERIVMSQRYPDAYVGFRLVRE